MYFNYEMIVPCLCCVAILICALKSFFGEFKPLYYAITMLAVLTTSFLSFLRTPTVAQCFPLLLQLVMMCYCLFIYVKMSVKNGK